MSRPSPTFVLSLGSGVLLGAWLVAGDPGVAHADEPRGDAAYLCRAFKQPLEGGAVLDTSDRTSEAGQWAAEQRSAGWRVHGVDFEVSQKPSGFAQGYVQVCLTR